MDKNSVNRKRTYGWTRWFESDKIVDTADEVVDVLDNFYKKYNLKPNFKKEKAAFLCPLFF
jgi:hypothetical protein